MLGSIRNLGRGYDAARLEWEHVEKVSGNFELAVALPNEDISKADVEYRQNLITFFDAGEW